MSDVFKEYTQEEESLVRSYLENNKKKKEAEDWLKANKPKVMQILGDSSKKDFGDIRVSIVSAESTKLDQGKLEVFLKSKGFYEQCLTQTIAIDEAKVESLVTGGLIDIEELTEKAFTTTPLAKKLLVKEIVKESTGE